MEFLILLAVVCGIIALYVITMALNAKVPIPESCKEAYLEAQSCESCASKARGCNISEALEFMKEVKL